MERRKPPDARRRSRPAARGSRSAQRPSESAACRVASPGARLETLTLGAEQLGVALTAAACARLLRYLELLEKWNHHYNLTAVRDPDLMVTQHLLDSLALLPHVHDSREGSRVLDVGSGAGLPGLVFALARSDLEVTLLDASAKKTRFLTQARIDLEVANCDVVQARAESWRPPRLFDCVVMRAVTSLAHGFALAAPLLAPGGALLMPKGRAPDAELAELTATPAHATLQRLRVPGLDAERHLVVLRDCRTMKRPV